MWNWRVGHRAVVIVFAAAASSAVTNPGIGGTATALSASFTQCPAVGASPTCEVLLVVNAERSVSVQKDPSVGPYDGGDDTLVGVVNQSRTPVDAITVTGPGSGLGALDGDGLCTFGIAGCPFGPTGYEGPKMSLVTDPAQPDSAEVDFTGGLGSGSTAFFSLEGALATAQVTARQGHIGAYLQQPSENLPGA